MARIVVSYLIVVPLVAAALVFAKRWRLAHLASAVALVWSAKLIITSSLYSYFAGGSAQKYLPAPVVEKSHGDAQPHTIARSERSGSAEIFGTIRDRGLPVAGAIVLAADVRPAAAASAHGRVAVTIAQARYDRPLYLVTAGDEASISNQDRVLHNVRAHHDRRTTWNIPLPPGSAARELSTSEPGVYELSCDTHPSERATLVVAHPAQAVVTDGAGQFALRGIPPGDRTLEIFHSSGARGRTVVTAGGRVHLSIDLSDLTGKR